MSLSHQLVEAMGYDVKKGKTIANGIQRALVALGREAKISKSVRIMTYTPDTWTVWWFEKRSYSTSTMSFKIFVRADGSVSVVSYSNNHRLKGYKFPYTKRRSHIAKMVRDLGLKKKAAPAPAPAPSKLSRVPGFLRSIKLGPGGSARNVQKMGGRDAAWEIEPTNRQRLDHYVGQWYDPGPDDDPEGWDEDGWDEDYAGPIRQVVRSALDREFGKGMFSIDVGDKGYVYVHLTPKGKKEMGA